MLEPHGSNMIKRSNATGGAGSTKDFQLSESSIRIIPSHRVDITNCASGVLAATQYLFADQKLGTETALVGPISCHVFL